MISQKFKYSQYLSKFKGCPPDNFSEVEKTAFRWENRPITKKDFLPLNVIKSPPKRILDNTDKICMGYGLSMFNTLKDAKMKYLNLCKKLNPQKKGIFKQDKGSFILKVEITKEDGIADEPNSMGHFTLHEYENSQLNKKIIDSFDLYNSDGTIKG